MIQSLVLFSQFFTRIPIPVNLGDVTNMFKKSIQYITFFGFLMGAIEALLFWVYTLALPVWFAWILFWITDGIVTGGFHLDALADTMDGLFSSRPVDRIFEIMKDSRLGTMGSLALLYFYAIVIGCGMVIIPEVSTLTMAALVATTVMMTKTGVSVMFYKMVYVGGQGGLASIWTGIQTWRILVAQGFSLIVISLTLSWPGIIAYVVMLIGLWIYRLRIIKMLGGLSGDTIGAAAEFAQVFFLLAYAISMRWLG